RGESGWRPARARTAKRVVVVGAGPAGLQAACVAAQRGHDVTLMGASPHLGGKLRWEAQLPGREEYGNVLAWMERQLHGAGTKVELGRPAGAERILALDPGVVILATGATLRRPEAIN